jgi:hypothetical protein
MRLLVALSLVCAALGSIPVYVMMPLDTVSSSGLKPGISSQLQQLASGGVAGIMVTACQARARGLRGYA